MTLKNRLKERKGRAECQSTGDGQAVWGVETDNQPYRKRRLFTISYPGTDDSKGVRCYS